MLVVAWVAAGDVPLDEWISHQLPWTAYREGFEMVRDKRANKVALMFGS